MASPFQLNGAVAEPPFNSGLFAKEKVRVSRYPEARALRIKRLSGPVAFMRPCACKGHLWFISACALSSAMQKGTRLFKDPRTPQAK